VRDIFVRRCVRPLRARGTQDMDRTIPPATRMKASERDAATFLEHEDAGKDRGRANEISCCVGHSGSRIDAR